MTTPRCPGYFDAVVKPRVLTLFAATALVQLLATSTASANHQKGSYEGTAATGGIVRIAVTFPGASGVIGGFTALNVPTNCGVQTYFGNYDDPISEFGDHPFAHTTSPEMNYAGSFPSAGVAAGTLTWVNCSNQVISWTATLQSETPVGDKKVPSAAERKCRRIANKKKRKLCLKKLACRKIKSKAKRKRCLEKLAARRA